MRILITIFLIIFATNASAGDVKPRLISVSGQAEVYAVPDEVNVSISVEVIDRDLGVAQSKNDDITAKFLQFVKNNLRIDEKYVQTNYINVNPVYEYNTCGNRRCAKPEFSHFETKKGITVRLKDTKKLQDLLDEAIEIGVTKIGSVTFATSKMDELKKEARILAAKNAKDKAVEVASVLDVKVGKPYTINVDYQSSPVISHNPMMVRSLAVESKADTISLGQISISAKVDVAFDIED